jgi:hypothetical protein
LSFLVPVGKVGYANVKLTNTGSCAIEYRWKKVPSTVSFEFETLDQNNYFNLHQVTICVLIFQSSGLLNPKKSKYFTFTFHSDNAGHFHADYQLETDPKLAI